MFGRRMLRALSNNRLRMRAAAGRTRAAAAAFRIALAVAMLLVVVGLTVFLVHTVTLREAGVGLASPDPAVSNVDLLARLIAAEAQGEPYVGMVGVGAVVMNRVQSPSFPKTIPAVVYQPGAFESVSNGLIWRRSPTGASYSAARDALNGWDPVYGALFFWNPSKPTGAWIWSRPIVRWIGRHVFAR